MSDKEGARPVSAVNDQEDICPVCSTPISAKPAVLDEMNDRWVHIACTRLVFQRHT